MVFKDQLQRELKINNTPRRIVSLVPSQTELLVDLGLENSLVGVTKFCVHPPHIRKNTTVVGGTKTVNYSKIKDLKPDIVLCNKEENTREIVENLEKFVQVHVSEIVDFNDALELINQYGNLFGREEKAQELIKRLLVEKEDFENSTILKPLRVAYFIWRKPWMVAGGNTFINYLLELNGWKNVFGNREYRYPQIKIEDLKSQNPDLILLSSEPFPFKEKHIKELEKLVSCKIALVDGKYFSWYGSRMLPAFKYFRELQIKLSSSL